MKHEGSNRPLFDVISDFLSSLEDNQVELMLDLTEQFCKLTYEGVLGRLKTALSFIPNQTFQSSSAFFSFPLIDPSESESNSATSIHAPFHNSCFLPLLRREFDISDDKVFKYKSISSLNRHHDRGASLVVIVDDFVGTGTTANRMIEYCKTAPQILKTTDTVVFVSAVAMRTGVQCVEGLGYKIYAAEIHSRGISDSEIILRRPDALDVMDNIESHLKFDPKYRWGFEKSEALVSSFIRSPDNTFPAYWAGTFKNGKNREAPFPR